MWNFPSHLSQPSRRKMYDFIPISPGEQTAYFTPKNCDFGAKQEEKKENSQPHRTLRPLPAVLPPVGRFVASQGGGGVRIPPGPFGGVSGSFSVRRKRSRRKGRRRGHPRPGLSGRRCGSHTPVHIGPFPWNSGCAPHKDSAPEIPVLQTILSSSNEDHLFPGNMPVTVLFIVLLFPIFGARFRFPFLFFKFLN